MDRLPASMPVLLLGERGNIFHDTKRAISISPYLVASLAVLILVPDDLGVKLSTACLLAALVIFRGLAEARDYSRRICDLIPVAGTVLVGALMVISSQELYSLIILFACLRVASDGSRSSTLTVLASSTVVLIAAGLAQPSHLGLASIVWIIVLPIVALPAQRRAAERNLQISLNPMLADVVAELLASEDPREGVVTAAADLGEADVAMLFELHADGDIRATAAYGVTYSDQPIESGEACPISLCIGTNHSIFLPFADRSPESMPAEMTGSGLCSLITVPITSNGATRGALCAGWTERVKEVSEFRPGVVGLIAREAASTIDYADLLSGLAESASRDPLTGLSNRRAWDQELQSGIFDSLKADQPLSIAVLDLDHFKKFNDREGHQAGDDLLKSAAKSWSSKLRSGDTLFRWGGEEFTILLLDCDAETAVQVTERLREVTPRGETASAGVATWDGKESADEFVGRADGALYEAKQAGRDRTIAWSAGTFTA